MHDIDRLVAGIAPDPGPGMTPLARELMEEITELPAAAAPAPRRRRWVAAPVLVTLAGVLSFGLAQAPASAALDIDRVGDHYVITVQDLMADPEVYQAELKARGLDIRLRLVATSASQTGRMFVVNDLDRLRSGVPVPVDGPITTIDGPGPCPRPAGCPVGVKVPVDFAKKAEITLGRRARPGERYKMPPGIAAAGEPLHCVDYVNKPVAEIVAMLRERDVTPRFISAEWLTRDSSPDGWYVHLGVMTADREALLLVGPRPHDKAEPPDPSC
ncbi:hypothetical protein [Nonomuraea sp. NPDC050643]|uniref:hypothetical protein n=1 Tax=Nonomuraea sp. NPDC050643 TaxID=3155660 RepID=UPI0033E173C7